MELDITGEASLTARRSEKSMTFAHIVARQLNLFYLRDKGPAQRQAFYCTAFVNDRKACFDPPAEQSFRFGSLDRSSGGRPWCFNRPAVYNGLFPQQHCV